MDGSPKALVQHLAGETSLLGTAGVQPRLPGPSVIMRGGNGHGRAHHNDSTYHKQQPEEQVIGAPMKPRQGLRQCLRGRKLNPSEAGGHLSSVWHLEETKQQSQRKVN